MMKHILSLLSIFLITGIAIGQISQGGLPISVEQGIDINQVKTVRLNTPDLNGLRAEDAINDQTKGRLRIGTLIETNLSFGQEAEKYILPDGRKVYRLIIQAQDAQAINFYFENFKMSDGNQFYIYSQDQKQILGAYTRVNNTNNKVFSTEYIYSTNAVLEYVQSANDETTPNFILKNVGFAYRHIYTDDVNRDFGDSDACQVNANCTEGDNWTDQKKSVVRILVTDSGSQFWCTGATINTEKQDCTPYLLTAEHCGQTASASDINQWIFYFGYEAPNCANPPSEGTLASQTMTGATLKSQSNDGGGNTGSDFMLLELNSSIPDSYSPYFAGWAKQNTAPSSGVSIHHPSGDIKKISTFSTTATSTSFGGATQNTHWAVTWVATSNGHGVTEQGSSGSPLFDQNGRIVGSLTGGAAFCSNPTAPDEYGKLSYHWESNGSGSNRQLKGWLDPDNTGINTLDGIAQPCLTNVSNIVEAPTVGIYPNPTTNTFVLDWDGLQQIANVRIIDMVGKELARWNNIANQQVISLSDFTNGVYLVEIQLDEFTVTRKVVKL